MSDTAINQMLQTEWTKIRSLTYDYLAMLTPEHLALRLPFAESQTLGYQFWCMVGAHESYLKKLEQGEWVGFSCSLNGMKDITPAVIRQQMAISDEAMAKLLGSLDLNAPLKDGTPAHATVMQMIKHEMHHHGQLINFMFCHHLPIPQSWHQEWALAYD